jgi:hypothetical protein
MKLKIERHLEKLSIILCVASIAFLAFSMRYNVSAFSENDVLGLVQKLNISYWFGLASILASSLLLAFSNNVEGKRREILFLFEACFLALYLYAAAALVESNWYYPDTWGHSASVMSILVYGSFTNPGVTWYASRFPGAFIWQSAVSQITSINFFALIKYYPVLFSLLVVPIYYVFLRKFFSDARTVYLATIFLVSGSVWVFPRWFSPNSVAFFFYLLILYFAFSPRSKKAIGLSFLFGVAAIFSNPTTIPFIILSIISLWIGWKLFKRLGVLDKQDILVSDTLFSFSFVLFISVSWLAWLKVNAPDILSSLISEIRNFTFSNPTERLSVVSPVLQSGVTMKIDYSLLFVLGGAVGVFYMFWKLRRKSKIENGLPFLAIGWVVACFVLGLISGFFQGGEFYERSLLYAFVPLTALAFTIFKSKYGKVILLLIILVGTPLSLFAAYHNESFEYSPISDSYGGMFIANHNLLDFSSITASYPTAGVVQFYILQWCYEHNVNPSLQHSDAKFFVWSQTSERFYVNYVEGRNYSLISSYLFVSPNMTQGSDLLYDNGGFRLYSTPEGIPSIGGTRG